MYLPDNLKRYPPAPFLLLLCVSLILLPHLVRIPLWLSFLTFGILIWRGLHDLGRVRLPGRFVRYGIILFGIAGLLFHYHSLIGRQAGTSLLLLLTAMKLMELQSRRDAYVMLFLCYFVVILGFLFSQSIPMTLYMVVLLLALLTTQIFYSHPNASEAGWRQLLPHGRLAGRIILQASPLALALFILFPRVTGPLWAMPDEAYSSRTGLSDKMSPGGISRLRNDNSVAFRVKFAGDPPGANQLYWRGIILWRFDGKTWDAPEDHRYYQKDSLIPVAAGGPALDYTVTLEPHEQRWLFLLDTPAVIPENAYLTLERQLLTPKPVDKLLRYRASSYLNYRYEKDVDWRESPRYLALPARVAPKTRKLISTLRARHSTDRELVRAVLRYFYDNPFYYSRTPPLLFDDPVDEFLFETRSGFCEHYASSFTVMMRLAGIPARVVVGYQGGEMNPLSDYMIVRQSDAHAWSEVWLADYGWMRIDPTSMIPPGRIENSDDLRRRQPETRIARELLQQPWILKAYKQARFALDAINNRWNQWVVGFNQKRQTELFGALGYPDIHWRELATLLGLAVTVILLALSWRLFRMPLQKKDPLLQAYDRFCKRLAAVGLEKALSETPAQFAQRVKKHRQDLSHDVDVITRLYQRLRYGRTVSATLMRRLLEQVQQFKPQRHVT